MAIPRNLSNLAPGADTSGVLSPAKGGTGLASPGASGNVLTSDGTSWASSALPASGAMTLISSQTPSNGSSTVSFTGLSGYINYLIIVSCVGFSGQTNVNITVGTGSGPSYITSGYNGTFFYIDGFNQNNASQNNSASSFRVFGAGNGGPNATAPGANGCISIFTNSTHTAFLANSTYPYFSTPLFENFISGGRVANSGNITAIKFDCDASSFAGTGKISLYGLSV